METMRTGTLLKSGCCKIVSLANVLLLPTVEEAFLVAAAAAARTFLAHMWATCAKTLTFSTAGPLETHRIHFTRVEGTQKRPQR
jgi:hypothetical protein